MSIDKDNVILFKKIVGKPFSYKIVEKRLRKLLTKIP